MASTNLSGGGILGYNYATSQVRVGLGHVPTLLLVRYTLELALASTNLSGGGILGYSVAIGQVRFGLGHVPMLL